MPGTPSDHVLPRCLCPQCSRCLAGHVSSVNCSHFPNALNVSFFAKRLLTTHPVIPRWAFSQLPASLHLPHLCHCGHLGAGLRHRRMNESWLGGHLSGTLIRILSKSWSIVILHSFFIHSFIIL